MKNYQKPGRAIYMNRTTKKDIRKSNPYINIYIILINTKLIIKN
nr:MAG TPA: hypothetical protein [Caudoviricetes sp.]